MIGLGPNNVRFEHAGDVDQRIQGHVARTTQVATKTKITKEKKKIEERKKITEKLFLGKPCFVIMRNFLYWCMKIFIVEIWIFFIFCFQLAKII